MNDVATKEQIELGPFAAKVIGWMDEHGVSGREMAKRCNLSASYFTTLRTGKTGIPNTRTIQALSQEIGEDLVPYAFQGTSFAAPQVAAQVARALSQNLDIESNVSPAPDTVARQFERGPLARDVPMLGVSVGGEDHDFSFNGEISQHIERPRGLAQARKAYALYVVGTSMVPAYEENTTIFINPSKPPAIDDYVVLELFPEGEWHDSGEFPAGKGLLKRLVKRTPEFYVLKQYNPPLEFKIRKDHVRRIERVVPPNELLGYS